MYFFFTYVLVMFYYAVLFIPNTNFLTISRCRLWIRTKLHIIAGMAEAADRMSVDGMNPVGREDFDDVWGTVEELEPFKTQINLETPRKIVTTNQSPDIPFDNSINPYRGWRARLPLLLCPARHTHLWDSPQDWILKVSCL